MTANIIVFLLVRVLRRSPIWGRLRPNTGPDSAPWCLFRLRSAHPRAPRDALYGADLARCQPWRTDGALRARQRDRLDFVITSIGYYISCAYQVANQRRPNSFSISARPRAIQVGRP